MQKCFLHLPLFCYIYEWMFPACDYIIVKMQVAGIIIFNLDNTNLQNRWQIDR